MVKKNKHKKNPYDLNVCKFLGSGNNGEVYLLPTGRVIKIAYNSKSFIREYEILEKVNGNKYFPRIYEIGSNYMVRECVNGMILSKYVKKNGMNTILGHNIIEMLKEFSKIKFKKIDLRCKDIFVQYDGSLKVIDPKKFYSKIRSFPKHLSKGLYNLGVLDFFFIVLKEDEPELYKKWYVEINKYISSIKNQL